MPDYGKDLTLLTGFPALFTLTEGPGLVVQAVYRRWTTSPATTAGQRIYKSQCRDLRSLLGARFDQTTLAGWERDLAEIAKADERVDDCTVKIDGSQPQKLLTLRSLIKTLGTTASLVIPFDTFSPEVLLGVV